MTPNVDQLQHALDGFAAILGATDGADEAIWHSPTPCDQWDIRALVGHVVNGNILFGRLLTGAAVLPAAYADLAADPLGDDAAGAFRQAADAVVAGFDTPGVLERPVTVPFGTVPGAVALHLRITELLAHGWDLARALEVDAAFPTDVVEQELAFSLAAAAQVPAERKVFAPSHAVPEDAPPLERLVGVLGRDPAWRP